MFQSSQTTGIFSATFRFLEVLYHSIVRSIRTSDGNALLGLLKSMLQTMVMVVVFYIMLSLMGGRAMAVRGDYFLFLLSGISLFMTHVKTVGAVSGSEGPNSPMMLHTPMNSLVAVWAAAISALYTALLTMFCLLLIYHTLWMPIDIEYPVFALGMVFLAWYSGVGVGYVMLALRPWVPGFVNIFKTVYQRVNLFASGKMMVANTLPFTLLPMFMWNPLFHIIDQCRGAVFINYVPHITSWQYAFWVSTALIVIGFIGEGFARQQQSVSWAGK